MAEEKSKQYTLTFDEVILKQLKKAAKNGQIKETLSRMLDKLEDLGPDAGDLLDSKLFLYELKSMRPPLRLYYKHSKLTDEIYVFEFEMKSSQESQQHTIDKLRKKSA